MENGSGYLVSVSEKEWENGIELLKNAEKRSGKMMSLAACVTGFFLDRLFWRSGMAVSSGENDRKYDFIFGKETEKRK